MKKSFLGYLLIHSITGYAQVTLQATDLNPQVGETFQINRTSWMDAGTGGNDLTWDLSGLSVEANGTISIAPPDGAYPGTDYTLSISYDDGYVSNAYEESNENGQWMHSFVFSGGGASLEYTYTNTQQLLQFPLSMGTTFTDSYSGPFDWGGVTGTRSGTVTYTVDGYGTLITAYGTYTDVLRVRLERQDTDVSGVGTFNTSTVTFLWYKAGVHYPLAYQTEDLLDPSYNEGGVLMTNGLGLVEQEGAQPAIFPNPVTDELTLEWGGMEVTELRVFSIEGEEVIIVRNPMSGMRLSTNDWSPGVYLVRLKDVTGTESVRRVMRE